MLVSVIRIPENIKHLEIKVILQMCKQFRQEMQKSKIPLKSCNALSEINGLKSKRCLWKTEKNWVNHNKTTKKCDND